MPAKRRPSAQDVPRFRDDEFVAEVHTRPGLRGGGFLEFRPVADSPTFELARRHLKIVIELNQALWLDRDQPEEGRGYRTPKMIIKMLTKRYDGVKPPGVDGVRAAYVQINRVVKTVWPHEPTRPKLLIYRSLWGVRLRGPVKFIYASDGEEAP